MEKYKLNKIIEITKTDSWKYLKEFFLEKEKKVLSYMRKLDLDNEKEKKIYKKRNSELNSFESFLSEIESLSIQEEAIKEMNEINKDINNSLLPKIEEENIDKNK